MNVNTENRALEDTESGSFSARFDNAGFFLDADDLTDDSADGGNFIANLKVVSHLCGFLFLLLLRSDHCEIHQNCHSNEDNDRQYGA